MKSILPALVTGLTPNATGQATPWWQTKFWLSQAPFIAPHAPHQASRYGTRLRVEQTVDHWILHFECQAPAPQAAAGQTPPLRAVGDPDLWAAEFVQILMPTGPERFCMHLTVTRAGQCISERFDKQRDPIRGWTAQTEETDTGWRGSITLPRSQVPENWAFRLTRWAPGEGLTRWPTPYGSWWHVDASDLLEVRPDTPILEHPGPLIEQYMQVREAQLFVVTGTPMPEEGYTLATATGYLNLDGTHEGDFLRHLQKRLKERPWLGFGLDPLPDMKNVGGLLHNRVYFGDAAMELGPEPDWDDEHGNVFGMVHSTRFDFLADIVAAYRHTGDETLARHAVYLIQSFMAGDDQRDALCPQRYPVRWRPGIIVSHRLVMMVKTLFSLLDTGMVSESLLLKLYAAARECADVLLPELPRSYPKNHSVIIGDHLVQLSVLCAELRAAAEIRDATYEHLRRALEVQFLPDGTQGELSTSYLMVCYMRLTEATDLSEADGVPVPEDITAWRRRILEVAAHYLLPNGQIAAFNDGKMGATVDTVNGAPKHLKSIIQKGGPVLDSQEAIAIATGGLQGTPPAVLSSYFPYAGHHIMRDGLTAESMGLAFDAGPFGLAHAHEDALSLMLVRYGKPLLIDIGSGAYDPDVPMRAYSVGTAAHSTILVDGEGQCSRRLPQFWKRSTPWEGHHFYGPEVQFAHGTYTLGYGEDGYIPVRHERAVLFVNQSYVILVDYLVGEGSHTLDSHFAVAPMPYRTTERGLRTQSGTGDVDINQLFPVPDAVSVACGQNEPFAGWIPTGIYDQTPHPLLSLQTSSVLPTCQITLVCPFRAEQEIPHTKVEISATEIEVTLRNQTGEARLQVSRQPLHIRWSRDQTHFTASSSQNGEQLHFS